MNDPPMQLRPNAEEPVPVLLMNTVWADRAGMHDSLSTGGELASWLAAVDGEVATSRNHEGVGLKNEDLESFRELRSALRRIAAEVTGDDRVGVVEVLDRRGPRWATDRVNAAAAAAPPVVTLSWPDWVASRSAPSAVRPPVAAMAAVATSAIELFGGPARVDLRACMAPGCVLYFVKDHPRREWCSASCGNRARARRHYERHRSAG